MKTNNLQKDVSNQDLLYLMQRGQTLHDQAIFDFLQAFVGKVRSLFKSDGSVTTGANGVKASG